MFFGQQTLSNFPHSASSTTETETGGGMDMEKYKKSPICQEQEAEWWLKWQTTLLMGEQKREGERMKEGRDDESLECGNKGEPSRWEKKLGAPLSDANQIRS